MCIYEIIWKSDLSDKIKRSFYRTAVVSLLLCAYNTWTLTKRMEKKLDENNTRIQRAVLNKSWKQHPTKEQLYGHLPLITKTIQVRRTSQAGHFLRIKEELVSDILLWTPSHGRLQVGRPARTYLQQLCADMELIDVRLNFKKSLRSVQRNIYVYVWWVVGSYFHTTLGSFDLRFMTRLLDIDKRNWMVRSRCLSNQASMSPDGLIPAQVLWSI